MMEDNGRETLCKVCGDKASGKHYGVPSCDGCRGFFKRSIRRYARNLDYVCKENGQCIVDVSRRNQCQACRFTKCLQVNMKRDAVQHERAPRSSGASMAAMAVVAASRKPTASTTALYPPPGAYPGAGPTTPYHPLLYPAAFFSFKPAMPAFPPAVDTNDLLRLTTAAHFIPRPPPEPLPTSAGKEDEVTSSEEAAATANDRLQFKKVSDNHMSTRLMAPLICTPGADGQTASFSLLPTENVYEFASKLLFLAIKWPRSISSFLQLSYRDQAILLEETWCELFVLTAAQWCFPVEESQLVPTGLSPERRQILNDEARRLRDLLTRCAALRIDHSEYACLKAIVLFKGESRGLCEGARVTSLQEQAGLVLSECGAARLGQLLLLLSPIRAICRSSIHELLFRPTVGDVGVERLLDEVVNATRPN